MNFVPFGRLASIFFKLQLVTRTIRNTISKRAVGVEFIIQDTPIFHVAFILIPFFPSLISVSRLQKHSPANYTRRSFAKNFVIVRVFAFQFSLSLSLSLSLSFLSSAVRIESDRILIGVSSSESLNSFIRNS